MGKINGDTNGWKKVWADYKNHIKVKCKRNKMGLSVTGGGPSNYCSLTQLDLLLSVHGISGRKEFSAPTSTSPSTNQAAITAKDGYAEENFEIMGDSILLSSEYNLEKKNINASHRPSR